MGTTTVAQDDGAAGPGTETRRRFGELVESLTENVSRTVVASEESVRSVLLALVAQGHLLLEDAPGVGKTLMAKTLARSISGSFSRVQCTPDLLPSDITGTSVFNMHESRFEFKPGPVFSNILLADEINRTGPRTQSALLEAMAEFQVSADGEALPLPKPFMVIATQNMLESHGIFPASGLAARQVSHSDESRVAVGGPRGGDTLAGGARAPRAFGGRKHRRRGRDAGGGPEG